MIGRATRRCDEIGKTEFKIYDPVDIYATLQEVTNMKPLVKDPKITIEQLIDEINDPNSYTAPGTKPETSHADDVLDVLSQKIMKVMRKATNKAEKKPGNNQELKQKLDELGQLWGVEPNKLHQHLHKLGAKQASEFIQTNSNLIKQLDEVKLLLGSEYFPLISEHQDEFKIREQSYGKYEKPKDYLDSFNDFIKNQLNQSVALSVVVNKPKDLTREQLKEVRFTYLITTTGCPPYHLFK